MVLNSNEKPKGGIQSIHRPESNHITSLEQPPIPSESDVDKVETVVDATECKIITTDEISAAVTSELETENAKTPTVEEAEKNHITTPQQPPITSEHDDDESNAASETSDFEEDVDDAQSQTSTVTSSNSSDDSDEQPIFHYADFIECEPIRAGPYFNRQYCSHAQLIAENEYMYNRDIARVRKTFRLNNIKRYVG
ncbi:hypothetical protein HK098_002559 [Nowakowskiella sp. JEL0407]|nr:hypothetical protein HK098_002559 [Nowakowskiella sp. JEL0407]